MTNKKVIPIMAGFLFSAGFGFTFLALNYAYRVFDTSSRFDQILTVTTNSIIGVVLIVGGYLVTKIGDSRGEIEGITEERLREIVHQELTSVLGSALPKPTDEIGRKDISVQSVGNESPH